MKLGPSSSWSYGNWIYNNICNQCFLPLTLWVRTTLRRGVLDTTSFDNARHCLAAARMISRNRIHYYNIAYLITTVYFSVWLCIVLTARNNALWKYNVFWYSIDTKFHSNFHFRNYFYYVGRMKSGDMFQM
jgi:hypothetical protein